MQTWTHGLDLRDLADRFGTPAYLHNLDALRDNFSRWLRLVQDPAAIRYPVKANPSPVVLRTLSGLGSGADCASVTEVQTALAHGIALPAISYNTPAFEPRIALWLLRAGGTVVADGPETLDVLASELGEQEREGLDGRLFVRVNPGRLPGYRTRSDIQRYTDHGSATSQFGIPSEELVERLAGYPLPVSGLHVHVGTQMDNTGTFVAALRFLHELADLLGEETGHRIDTLNLGGGLGIPFAASSSSDEDQSFPTVDELVDALLPHRRPELAYQVEPGNALVGDTAALLSRVVASKTTRGKRWAIADVGTDQLVKHTVARWEHPIAGPDHRLLPRTGPDGLAGPLCFAGDVLFPETDLSGIETGDPLLIGQAGSYCEAVSSRFNGRRAPIHVVFEAGREPRIAREREDPFFEPAIQTFLPEALDPGDPDAETRVNPDRVHALQSEYMHHLANLDLYEILEVRSLGDGLYDFVFDVKADVDFIAMPFAVRLVGDATIIAVGREMGWRTKPGPVWASRLSMSCGRVLPVDGPVVCRVALGPLSPSPSPGIRAVAVAHYRLGEGEATGVAHVAVPGTATEAAGEETPSRHSTPASARES